MNRKQFSYAISNNTQTNFTLPLFYNYCEINENKLVCNICMFRQPRGGEEQHYKAPAHLFVIFRVDQKFPPFPLAQTFLRPLYVVPLVSFATVTIPFSR